LTSIPRAVKWSAILAGLFFFLCAYAEVLAFRGEVQTLDKSLAPLHVLAQKAGLPPLVGTLTDLGAVLSFFSCFLACITAAARVLFLMGRHGALHSVLGEAHEENRTPHRAVLLSSVAAFLPAGMPASPHNKKAAGFRRFLRGDRAVFISYLRSDFGCSILRLVNHKVARFLWVPRLIWKPTRWFYEGKCQWKYLPAELKRGETSCWHSAPCCALCRCVLT
jgi:hypothetical protein